MADKEVKTSIDPMEQFILLAKSTKGAGIISLVKQVLETPGIYVFGELLQMPNVQETCFGKLMPSSMEYGQGSSYLKLLNIFAYGKYSDYRALKGVLPPLTNAQTVKLQHLTIVSLASASKYIPYNVLLKELEISNVRELEDLIIEAIYADIIHGKLDQKNSQLEVEYSIGRDIKPENVASIVDILNDWCNSCDVVLNGIEKQIQRSNNQRDKNRNQKAQFDAELEDIKTAIIKASSSQDLDDDASTMSSYLPPRYSKVAPAAKGKSGKTTSRFFTSKR